MAGKRRKGSTGIRTLALFAGLLLSSSLQTHAAARHSDTASSPAIAITGIRHWSTATYTRVAIDLAGEVTYEAARVANPDRIFFDLHNSRLTPELLNKSFAVTDDGFLKRIRAGQSSPGVIRIVLDVNEVTEYSAFILPNPYRLIIDIHGAKISNQAAVPSPRAAMPTPETEPPVTVTAARQASVAANTSGLPAMPVTDGGVLVRPTQREPDTPPAALVSPQPAPIVRKELPQPRTAVTVKATPIRPVPNTTADRSPATPAEIAAVGNQPSRVDATTEPTTQPVAVSLGSKRRARPEAAAPARPAQKTADGQTSLIRALGLRVGRIVIDAGHGGHDSGTLGVDGIEEKDIVLDVALRLGKALHDRLGAEIIYTRSDDTFIPLETRTAIANKAQADLFISIHANSSSDETARGVETYYLNFTSSPDALDVAARENAVSGQSVHQLSDLVKKIALKDKIAESREFAADVEASLYSGLQKGNGGLKDRGVKKAPFVVLIGANMPSILAEISFVTNPRDAAQLRTPAYRQRVAESLYAGVAKYESSLGGAKTLLSPTDRASIH